VLVNELRVIDPKLFKPEPLPASTVALEVTINPDNVSRLVRSVALGISGLGDEAPSHSEPSVLWREGASELLLLPGRIQTRLADGIIAISVPVRCDQCDDAFVHVSIFVGEPGRPAGLVAATESRPRGPAAVVDVWGERLVAFAWRTVLELVTQLAAESGRDEDGAPLLPVAMTATANGLSVLPMARHAMDRVST
jgi:hypothetical protein